MKLIPRKSQSRRDAFTLIEMIGVLAIVAILASLLVPRVFQAIKDSEINSAVSSYNTLKSATTSYYGKYGRFGDSSGAALTSLPAADWDSVLLSTGFLEKPLEARIASVSDLQIAAGTGDSTTAPAIGNTAYDLDGSSTNGVVNDAGSATHVVEVVLSGVTLEDAFELSRRIDGDSLSAADNTTDDDTKGRVKYNYGTTNQVKIYITHR